MNIAICDDELRDVITLQGIIREAWEYPEKLEIYAYSKGEDLLNANVRFNVVFLDIDMGRRLDGTRVAQLLRIQNEEVLLAYYTAYDIPASRIVDSNPFSYIIKYGPKQDLKSKVIRILQRAYEMKALPSIPITYDGKTFIIPLQDIIYIEIQGKGSSIALTKTRAEEIKKIAKYAVREADRTLRSGEKLGAYYEKLKHFGFLYAKKSYIINARHIIARQKESVIVTGGIELTVARSQKKQFDESLIEYFSKQYFEER